MIFTKEQLEQRLNSEKNILNQLNKPRTEVIIKDGLNHKGRPGAHNLTEEEKVAIGYLAHVEGKDAVAEIFGITENTVRHIKQAEHTDSNGRGTQKTVKDHNLKAQIEERLQETKLTVSERAAERLLASFGFMTDDKLENLDAKGIASVASQISNVMRNMTNGSSSKENSGPNVRVTINRPRESSEESFDVIEVRAS